MNIIKIIIGNNWTGLSQVTEDNSPKNCTDLLAKITARQGFTQESPLLFSKSITWITINEGIGQYELSVSETTALLPGTGYWEAQIYKADGTYNKTYARGIVIVESSKNETPWV